MTKTNRRGFFISLLVVPFSCFYFRFAKINSITIETVKWTNLVHLYYASINEGPYYWYPARYIGKAIVNSGFVDLPPLTEEEIKAPDPFYIYLDNYASNLLQENRKI